MSRINATAAIFLLALLAGCSTIADRFDDHAIGHGLLRREIMGGAFRHVIFHKPGMATGGILHIYLEGDGSPLLYGRGATVDPTPRRPIMPALMALDPGPAVLLGRPCYHGLSRSPPCRPEHWTQARFGAAVVDSLVAAARRLIAAGGYDGAVLIGHSGGGVLTLLMAPALPTVRAVIAVATVADTNLWARHHGLEPLTGSLNPNALPVRPNAAPELFLVGDQDRVTPMPLVRQALRQRPQAHLTRYQDFDHACCWGDVWPQVLTLSRKKF